MPYNEFQKQILVEQSGYDYNDFEYDEGSDTIKPRVRKISPGTSNDLASSLDAKLVNPSEQELQNKDTLNPLQTAGFSFVENALPSMAGGFAAGRAMQILGNKLIGKGIPGTLAGIGLIGGSAVATGRATGAVQDKALNAIAPDAMDTLHRSQQENPLAATTGSLASIPLGGMNPSPYNAYKAAKSVGQLAIGMSPKADEIANLSNVAAGAGIGTGIDALSAYGTGNGEQFNPLESLLINTIFNKPNPIGHRFGFPDTAEIKSEPNRGDLLTDEQYVNQRKQDLSNFYKSMGAEIFFPEEGSVPFDATAPVAKTKRTRSKKTAKTEEVIPTNKEYTTEDLWKDINAKKSEEELNYQNEETPRTQLEKDTAQRVTENNEPTNESSFWRSFFSELANRRGTSITEDGTIVDQDTGKPVLGQTDAEGNITVNPLASKPDTRPHELTHVFIPQMLKSPRNRDRVIANRYLNRIKETKDYKDWAANRRKENLNDSVEEYAATNTGINAYRRALDTPVEKPSIKEQEQKWWNDTFNYMKTRFTKHATLQEMQDTINYKLMHDPSFKDTFKKYVKESGKSVSAIPKNQEASVLEDQKKNPFEEVYKAVDEAPDIEVNKEVPAKEYKPNYPTDDKMFKYQNESSIDQSTKRGPFYLESIKHLEDNYKSDKAVDSNQLISSLRNKYPGEWDLLEESGIRDAFPSGSKVSGKELANWINENGPRVEVKKLEANKANDISKEEYEFNQLKHEWYDNLTVGEKGIVDSMYYYDNYESINDILSRQFIGESLKKAKKYVILNKNIKAEKNSNYNKQKENDSATRRYTQVNPKPLDKMPGAVDLLVRIPVKDSAKYKSNHYPQSGDNLLAHVRGYEETLPNGKKVFHVFEVQSDWAQQRRGFESNFIPTQVDGNWRIKSKINQNLYLSKSFSSREEAVNYIKSLESDYSPSDPLLKDYNRLAIKAAIKHAKEIGADYVAISDAETAMMTEQHDKMVNEIEPVSVDNIKKYYSKNDRTGGYGLLDEIPIFFGEDAKNGKYVKFKDGFYRVDKPELNDSTYNIQLAKELAPYAEGKENYIPQEQGMRFNYDDKLQKIAQDLTGSEGESISFGEHQNALGEYSGRYELTNPETGEIKKFDYGDRPRPQAEYDAIQSEIENLLNKGWTQKRLKSPRDNLVFKNQDGSPKVDITAKMYPVNKTKDEFTLTRKKYQNDSILKQTETPEFKRWFGESKVVDEETGKPLVVYHGDWSGNIGESFDENKLAYFTINPMRASDRIKTLGTNEGSKIIPVYLSIKNPVPIELLPEKTSSYLHNIRYSKIIEEFKSKGYDGIIGDENTPSGDKEFVAFYPEQIKSAIGNTGAFDPTNKDIRYSNSSILGKLAADVDKVRDVEHPKANLVADAFNKFYEQNRSYKGKFFSASVNKLISKHLDIFNPKELWVQDNKKMQDVVNYYYDMMDKGSSTIKPDATIQQIVEDLKKITLYAKITSKGMKSKLGDPNYLPQIPARDVLDYILNKPSSTKGQQLIKDWFEYYTKDLGLTLKEAEKALKIFKKGYEKQNSDIASQYGPIDKAEGMGIPRSWREKKLVDILSRFSNRYARRLAFIDAIEKNSVVKDALENPSTGIGSADAVRKVMADIQGQRDIDETNREAISGIVRAGWLGTLTGAKDFVTNPFLGFQHQELGQAFISPFKAWSHFSKNLADSYEAGINRMNISAFEFNDSDVSANFFQGLRRFRDVINTATGRNFLEKATRATAFGQGKFVTLDNLYRARKGTLGAQGEKFLNDFFPDWRSHVKDDNISPKLINDAAARYVESVQGTYDPRGLPSVTMRGSWAPFLSLSRWSFEKMTNFEKYVVNPARKGNYRPLLMQTLGMFLGGTVVNKLVEEMTNKKERTPEYKEIMKAYEDKQDVFLPITYKLAALASLSGYAGMAGDVARMIMDKTFKNNVQGFSNPSVEGIMMIGENAADALSAGFKDGFDLELLSDFILQNIEDSFQVYRLLNAHLNPKKASDLEKSDKMRDIKLFSNMYDYDTGDTLTGRPNPFRDKDIKKFREEDDIRKAAPLAKELMDKAFEEFKEDKNLYKLKKALNKIRFNQFRTMPNPETAPDMFAKYFDYLVKTQGIDKAKDRRLEYLKKRMINRAKSEMIPSL